MIKVIKNLTKKTKKSSDEKVRTKAKKATSRARKKTLKKISPEELCSLVAKKAYEIYEQRGQIHGNDFNDWIEAEKNVISKFK